MLRTVVAGCVAVVGVGLLLAPDMTSARPGGFAGGRGIPAAPGALLVRPGFVPLKPPIVAPIHARPFAGFRHRRQLGSPATVWSSGDAVGYAQSPLVYPTGDPNVYGQPDQGRIVYVPPPPGCRSESKSVPSEAGGERKVTITRCWH
jgi:hypothetical protein